MKKAFALYGKGEIGKTETLNLLIDLLTVATVGGAMPEPAPKGHDRKRVFHFKELKIGVATRGDNAYEVKENCKFFESNACDIVFTATRTRGGSCNEIVAYAKSKTAELKWEKKENISDQSKRDSYNLHLAQKLFNKI
jgi:hypothetical protein